MGGVSPGRAGGLLLRLAFFLQKAATDGFGCFWALTMCVIVAFCLVTFYQHCGSLRYTVHIRLVVYVDHLNMSACCASERFEKTL